MGAAEDRTEGGGGGGGGTMPRVVIGSAPVSDDPVKTVQALRLGFRPPKSPAPAPPAPVPPPGSDLPTPPLTPPPLVPAPLPASDSAAGFDGLQTIAWADLDRNRDRSARGERISDGSGRIAALRCRIDGCLLAAEGGPYCRDHARLAEMGLLRTFEGTRTLACVARGCVRPAEVGAFCFEHADSWRSGDMELRREEALGGFVAVPIRRGPRAALGLVGLVAAAFVAGSWIEDALLAPRRAAATAAEAGEPAAALEASSRRIDVYISTAPEAPEPDREAALVAELRGAHLDPALKRAAIASLRGARTNDAIQALVAALADPNQGVRDDARRALRGLIDRRVRTGTGPVAAEPEAIATHAEREIVKADRRGRSQIVSVLGGLAGEFAVPVLNRRFVPDEALAVRLAAAGSLGRTGAGTAVGTLETLLMDPDASLRAEAALGLGQLCEFGSIPRLAALLADASGAVRDAARRSLERLSGERFGESAAAWSSWWQTSDARRVYERLDLALLDATNAPPALKTAALARLAAVRDRRVVAAVREELRVADPRRRQAAARLLRQLGAAAAIRDLATALADESPAVSGEAHRALVALTGVA